MSALQRQLHDLESENEALKEELTEALAIIKSLQQENLSLANRLVSYQGNSILSNDSTFVTSQCASHFCENCNSEIPTGNLDLHMAQCLRKTAKCKACNHPFNINELAKHIEEQISDVSGFIKDVENGDIAGIDMKVAHGAVLNNVLCDEYKNSLIHVAAKFGKKEIIQYCLSKGMSINSRNSFEETPLHLACGKFKDISMVKFLVTKGADYYTVNSLGDSCVELAKRSGFHEAVIYFQQKDSSLRPMTTSSFSRGVKIRTPQMDLKFDL